MDMTDDASTNSNPEMDAKSESLRSNASLFCSNPGSFSAVYSCMLGIAATIYSLVRNAPQPSSMLSLVVILVCLVKSLPR